MSIRMCLADHPTAINLSRFRDTQNRPPADRSAPAKPADPIALFTRDELRAMVMELMG